MSRVALVTADDRIEQQLASSLRDGSFDDVVATCHDILGLEPAQAAAELAERHADVVVLGPGQSLVDALCLAEAIERDHPEIATVLVGETSPDVWELAMQAGVRYVVDLDSGPTQLTGIVRRILETAERRRSNIVIDLRDQIPTITIAEEPTSTGRIITVLSPKGGAGKTTVSTNLAIGLARQRPFEVAIVDLDLQFGDVASALQLSPTTSLADLNDHEAAALKALLTSHADGLFALCAPEDPAIGEQIEPAVVTHALRTLAIDLPYVIVDTGAGLDAVALAAIDVATDLVLVGAMDVPSIRSLRKLLDALDRLEMNAGARHVVLNRADSRVGMSADDVADALGLPIAVSLPSSRSVPLSVNQGLPVIVSDPKSPVSRPLHDLIALFGETPTPKRGGFLRLRKAAR